MTPRPHQCDFCQLATPAVRQIRHKRLRRLVWVCADPKHLGRTATLTKRQRGIVADRMTREYQERLHAELRDEGCPF